MDHDWEETERTAATCTDPEYIYYKCSKCGETKTETGNSALGHDWGEGWIEDIPAQVNVTGSRHRTCIRCGNTETETIPALHEQEPNPNPGEGEGNG